MDAEQKTIFIQPQAGLGDLIQALPKIELELSFHKKVIVATNHGYALEPYRGIVNVVPVEYFGVAPIVRDNFIYLKYNRYGNERYRDAYFPDKNYHYETYAEIARDRYEQFYKTCLFQKQSKKNDDRKYTVFAPPRAAARHKNTRKVFECAPDVVQAFEFIRSFSGPIVIVGKQDVYPVLPEFDSPMIDLRDNTTFAELCALIIGASAVVSQLSAITVLAGFFGKPTKFLKSAIETQEQFEKHVWGTIWHKQEII